MIDELQAVFVSPFVDVFQEEPYGGHSEGVVIQDDPVYKTHCHVFID